MARNLDPKPTKILSTAICTLGAPASSPRTLWTDALLTLYIPVIIIINAVAEDIIQVSIYTDNAWTNPCFAGCETSAAPSSNVSEPAPAPFEKRSLCTPYVIADPTMPPNVDSVPNALEIMTENTHGTASILKIFTTPI